jgi:hypothetical protein
MPFLKYFCEYGRAFSKFYQNPIAAPKSAQPASKIGARFRKSPLVRKMARSRADA